MKLRLTCQVTTSGLASNMDESETYSKLIICNKTRLKIICSIRIGYKEIYQGES